MIIDQLDHNSTGRQKQTSHKNPLEVKTKQKRDIAAGD
jgi:hypothetical protein